MILPVREDIRYLSDVRPGAGSGFANIRLLHAGEDSRVRPDPDPPSGTVGVVASAKTGEERLHEGSIDDSRPTSTGGERRGDRQSLFWALTDLCAEIKRQQAAARGVSQ